MEQSELPQKLVIIGGGFVGLEFADMYAKFGAEVTILENANEFLSGEDRDIADEIFRVLTAKKINILTGISVQKIADLNNGSVSLRYKNKDGVLADLETSAILSATGRKTEIRAILHFRDIGKSCYLFGNQKPK